MIKEDKVILMTKLAIYEQGEGKKEIPTSKYFRSDYISIRMIESFVSTTLVYILLIVVGVLAVSALVITITLLRKRMKIK